MIIEPKYSPILRWCALLGMTRNATYQRLASGDLRAIKQPGGRRTLIDVEHGLAWLRAQPIIQTPSATRMRSSLGQTSGGAE